MPVQFLDTTACFVGACTVEEAEALCEWLRTTPDAEVDLSACQTVHSALLQLLLVAGPRLVAPLPDAVLAAALAASPGMNPVPR